MQLWLVFCVAMSILSIWLFHWLYDCFSKAWEPICRPNCCFCSEGNVLHVRATEDIPKGKEVAFYWLEVCQLEFWKYYFLKLWWKFNVQLCLSYINLYESRATRREQLAATKYFDCQCVRCMEPLSSSADRFLEVSLLPGGFVVEWIGIYFMFYDGM